MDVIVPFEDIVACIRNPPSVLPHPAFATLRALHLPLIKALKLFECPQTVMHG